LEASSGKTRFDELILQFHQPIYKYCYHMLRHRQDAEDAAQEVFLKAFRHMDHSEDFIQSTSAWLYKIAHNHCLNILKRKKLLSFIPFKPEKNQNHIDDSPYAQLESSMAIEDILSSLSSLDRSIMLLRILEDKTYEDIGVIISATPALVRKKFERAKHKIIKACTLEKGEPENEKTNISIV